MDKEGIVALGQVCGPFLALHLELIRLSGLQWVRRRDGWLPFDQNMQSALGLTKRDTRSKAVKKLLNLNFLEVRGTPGSRLEYRLNPHWSKPKAKVIDLNAERQARRGR